MLSEFITGPTRFDPKFENVGSVGHSRLIQVRDATTAGNTIPHQTILVNEGELLEINPEGCQ